MHYGLTGSGFPPSLQKRLINLVGDHQRIQVPNDISYCTLFSAVLGEGIPLGRIHTAYVGEDTSALGTPKCSIVAMIWIYLCLSSFTTNIMLEPFDLSKLIFSILFYFGKTKILRSSIESQETSP